MGRVLRSHLIIIIISITIVTTLPSDLFKQRPVPDNKENSQMTKNPNYQKPILKGHVLKSQFSQKNSWFKLNIQ